MKRVEQYPEKIRFRLKSLLVILLVTGLMAGSWSCAPYRVGPREAPAPAPGDDLFTAAEKDFQQGASEQALRRYKKYLRRFPQGPRAPAALFKAGILLAEQGDHEAARGRFKTLVKRFPASGLVEDARIYVLSTWYQAGNYQQVIAAANALSDEQFTESGLIRKYNLVAEAYLAMEKPMDAAYVLMATMKKVSLSGQKRLLVTLDRITRGISPETLQSLLKDIDEADYRGYLTCKLARKYMDRGDYERAMTVLSGFVDDFPGNRYAEQARRLVVRIDREGGYAPYTVGCLLPLSGQYEVFGKKALQGVQLAFQEFLRFRGQSSPADSEGKQSPAYKLIIRDTGSDPRQAVTAVKELIEARVAIILGPLGSFEAALTEAQNHHIPLIALTQKQNIPALGDYIFRNFLTPRMQVRALVAYACDTLGLTRLAVLYPDEAYGRVFAHAFWDEALLRKASIVGFESYNPRDTDFADPIKRLIGRYYEVPEELAEVRQARLEELGLLSEPLLTETPLPGDNLQQDVTKADGEAASEKADKNDSEEEMPPAIVDFEALFIPDGPSNAGLIIPQLAYHDIVDTLFLGTNLWHSPQLIQMAKGYAHGAVMPTGFWPQGQFAGSRDFSQAYERLFGEKPGFIEAVAYDNAKIAFEVLSEGKSLYRSQIKEKLQALDGFEGVTGLTSFGPDGDARKRLPLLKIQGRRFVEVTPSRDSDYFEFNDNGE